MKIANVELPDLKTFNVNDFIRAQVKKTRNTIKPLSKEAEEFRKSFSSCKRAKRLALTVTDSLGRPLLFTV